MSLFLASLVLLFGLSTLMKLLLNHGVLNRRRYSYVECVLHRHVS
jgi:hypothetical protein